MSKYDKASLVMIPSAVKAETLYSVFPVNGDGDFTHDRNAGTATRVNKDGYIETVSADVPRLDYPLIDGVVQDCPALLLEPSRTNIIPYSEAFDNAVWEKNQSSIIANTTISPDGTLNASKLVEDNTSNFHRIIEEVNLVSSDYSHTVFAKAEERKYFVLRNNINGSNINACFDLEDGVVVYNGFDESKIENYGNGWYRCFIKETSTNTSPRSFSLMTSDKEILNNNLPSYQGDGTSGLYIWGAQVEQGSYETSYIKTTSASVTRNADVCDSAGTSAEFNDSEGVVYLELKPIAFDSTHKRVTLSDNTSTNRIIMGIDSSNNVLATVYNGSNQAVLGGNYDGKENFQKVALKYKANDFSLYFNGFEVATDTSGSTYSADTLTELSFQDAPSGLSFYGRIKETGVFKEALTDTELEALTSWDSFTEMATGQEYSIR